jgi:hypothetical protein
VMAGVMAVAAVIALLGLQPGRQQDVSEDGSEPVETTDAGTATGFSEA